MALTAATPVHKGYLVDIDCRWDIIAASVDDRTEEELSTTTKSRYDSVSRYLCNSPRYRPEYNDLNLRYNEKAIEELKKGGVDELLAKHLGHIFIRDPLVIYEELLVQDNATSMDHFENIQSTNWQTLRFKPPPAESDIGWRVEFRSMEVQPNDFANAAFCVFQILLTRTIFALNPNFYMPLSLVDQNMVLSHGRDAIANEKFHFRTNIFDDAEAVIDVLSIDEIINGKSSCFEGLIPLIIRYLDTLDLGAPIRYKLHSYLQYVSDRASCKVKTPAKAIRDFITSHPDYKHDSKVSAEITYDLMKIYENIC
jgi:glutamate--cysteine ligase catalytic subunit